jgi:hypothetical protein
MSGKNLVRKEFISDGTWTCPAGVLQVRALVFGRLSKQVVAGAGTVGSSASVNASSSGAYGWGGNVNGQVGNLSVTPTSSPVVVAGGLQWNSLGLGADNTFGVAANGAGFAWGLNGNGQLGTGDVTSRSSPVAIVGSMKWRSISGGASCAGIDVSGNAYTWGLNTNGQLGLGDVTPRSSPVVVLGGLIWQQVVSARSNFMLGVTTDGIAYAWGANANGQLGVGDITVRSSPILIVGGAGFQQWASVSGSAGTASNGFSVGVAKNGDAYAWGANLYGQLGLGDTTPRSSPVLVLGGLKWRSVICGGDSVIGITRDGLVYAWGRNESGQVGDGTIISKSSPVLVAGNYRFRQVSMGGSTGAGTSFALGLNVNGTLYAWGANANGQLGLGDTVPRSSPVIVVGSYIWRSIDNALLAEQIVAVTPGVSYPITQLGPVVAFGPTPLYTDPFSAGVIPPFLVLEYQA